MSLCRVLSMSQYCTELQAQILDSLFIIMSFPLLWKVSFYSRSQMSNDAKISDMGRKGFLFFGMERVLSCLSDYCTISNSSIVNVFYSQ